MATELNKLFRSLELKTGSPEEKIEGYLIAIAGASHYALTTAITKIIRGEIDSISKKFCPTAPELSSIIRDEMAFVKKQIELAIGRMELEDQRPISVKPMLLMDRIAQATQRMVDEDRALLFTVTSHPGFLARKGELPTGGIYCAILGAAYGPQGSASRPLPAQEVPDPVAADLDW
ncbi:hypothetical protein G8E10_09495 [Rhizobiaceae bacterium CRRU44]|uniref:Uncharacterized protein n=1 Tax=Ferranicluibacter rubi TaxID=2715133 RepID=A0AA43ZDN9_9HYPH|nr:hypothetical protein [Ferranicluibacter rubi]NHT75913.1 hypothetical protein [Ferranicluibacter rubi]NHT75973.1 hypothetical protein [Ferranicluibacter rubi]